MRLLTSCFLPFEVVSHTNQFGKTVSWLVSLTDCKYLQDDYNL